MSDMAIPEGGFHNLQGKKPIVIKKDAIGSVEEYDTELPGPCLQVRGYDPHAAVANLDVGQKITKRVGALSSLYEQESRNEVLVKKQRKTDSPKVKRSRKRTNKGLLTRRKSHKDILKQKWSESGTYFQGTLCKLVPIAKAKASSSSSGNFGGIPEQIKPEEVINTTKELTAYDHPLRKVQCSSAVLDKFSASDQPWDLSVNNSHTSCTDEYLSNVVPLDLSAKKGVPATKETNRLPVQVTNDVSSVGQKHSQVGSDKEDTDSINGENIDQEKLMDTGQSTRPSSCCSLDITKLRLGDSKQNQTNNGNKKQTKTKILHTKESMDLLQKVAASACKAAAPGIQQTFNAVSATHTVKSANRQDLRVVYPDKPQDKLKMAVGPSQAKASSCNFSTHKTDSLTVAVKQAFPTLSDVEPTLAKEIPEAMESPIPNFHALEQCGKDGIIGKSNFECSQSIVKSYLNKKHNLH